MAKKLSNKAINGIIAGVVLFLIILGVVLGVTLSKSGSTSNASTTKAASTTRVASTTRAAAVSTPKCPSKMLEGTCSGYGPVKGSCSDYVEWYQTPWGGYQWQMCKETDGDTECESYDPSGPDGQSGVCEYTPPTTTIPHRSVPPVSCEVCSVPDCPDLCETCTGNETDGTKCGDVSESTCHKSTPVYVLTGKSFTDGTPVGNACMWSGHTDKCQGRTVCVPR